MDSQLASQQDLVALAPSTWKVGRYQFSSRLILGSGRFESFEIMQQAIRASQTEIVTFAVRREKMYDSSGRNLLDFFDLEHCHLLPNTSGAYDAETAVRCARMGREILRSLEAPITDWVKLEVLADSRSLLPDPVETLRATELLVDDGFDVLCYTNDDPVMARKLKAAGAASVMPAGSPIGSGQGILNRSNMELMLDEIKGLDPEYPVILDAGVGTASDAVLAMEIGFDAVLMNTAIARAKQPIPMAAAMKYGVWAGFLARTSGRIAKSRFASSSSPEIGLFTKS